MNLALLLLSASPVLDLPQAPAFAAQSATAVTTYDAFVATEETPPIEDLKHPAIFARERRNNPIVAPEAPVQIV